MLRLPRFRYVAPSSLTEAARLLRDHGPEAMAVAGGTDLYPNMKRRQFEPAVLVGLRGLGELRGIRRNGDGGWSVGAGVTLTALARDPAFSAAYPALSEAAGLVSTPLLRNMGTLGGNLCLDTRCNYYNQTHEWRRAIGFCMKKDGDICLVAPGSHRCLAVASADTAPAAIALGASVRLVGEAGERVVPAADLYRDDGIDYLAKAPDEIVTELLLPPPGGWRSTYLKLRRRGSFDFPVLGVAAALRLDDEGTCREARIVMTGVGSRPVTASGAAEMLAGARPTPELVERAAREASRPAKPLDNTDMAHYYRKRMARVYVGRALRQLAGV